MGLPDGVILCQSATKRYVRDSDPSVVFIYLPLSIDQQEAMGIGNRYVSKDWALRIKVKANDTGNC